MLSTFFPSRSEYKKIDHLDHQKSESFYSVKYRSFFSIVLSGQHLASIILMRDIKYLSFGPKKEEETDRPMIYFISILEKIFQEGKKKKWNTMDSNLFLTKI